MNRGWETGKGAKTKTIKSPHTIKNLNITDYQVAEQVIPQAIKYHHRQSKVRSSKILGHQKLELVMVRGHL